MKNMDRRKLFQKAVIGASALTSMKVLANGTCSLTPAQTEGPFYPINEQEDTNRDLTRVKGRVSSAKGEVVFLKGVVKDQSCKPIKGALVEIWQACETGKYNHPSDPNQAALDPNFQYWGRATTNEKGEYWFKTIIPGAYQATNTWKRPPHIHFKVHLRGFHELTSQVYFKRFDKLNKLDRILQSLSSEERESVIVDFKDQKLTNGKVETVGHFDITIRSI